MPANLDEPTRRVIMNVTGVSILVLASACVYAYYLIGQLKLKLKKKTVVVVAVLEEEETTNDNNEPLSSSSSSTTSSSDSASSSPSSSPVTSTTTTTTSAATAATTTATTSVDQSSSLQQQQQQRQQQQQSSSSSSASSSSSVWFLTVGCLASFAIMLIASAILTYIILILGRTTEQEGDDGSTTTSTTSTTTTSTSTSSINFCEWDFQDHPYVAEPSNTASSIASYVPLALLGLVGPPSRVWKTSGHKRFAIAYTTLLAIGIGSTLLHAMLTATTQGGDELPMLWFVASTGYIVADIIVVSAGSSSRSSDGSSNSDSNTKSSSSSSTTTTTRRKQQLLSYLHRALPYLFGSSAIVATCVYVLARENFLPFYIMFVSYAWITLIGLLTVCFYLDWSTTTMPTTTTGMKTTTTNNTATKNENSNPSTTSTSSSSSSCCFQADVLLPVAIWTAVCAMVGISVWVAEMVHCAEAQAMTMNFFGLGPNFWLWFYNRAAHVIWHCSSGLLAWLLIQSLVAAKGTQDGWGGDGDGDGDDNGNVAATATIRWYLVPYVSFEQQHFEQQRYQQKYEQHIKQS